MELSPLPASSSPLGGLNKTDWLKTARGAGIYALGYLLTVVGNAVLEDLAHFDFSTILPDLPGIDEKQIAMGILAAGLASVIELGRRLMTNYKA